MLYQLTTDDLHQLGYASPKLNFGRILPSLELPKSGYEQLLEDRSRVYRLNEIKQRSDLWLWI